MLINDDILNVELCDVDLIITSPPYWNQKEYSFWPTYDNYMDFIDTVVCKLSDSLKSGRYCFWVIPDKLPFPPKENGTRERLYMPVYSDTERIAAKHGLICEYPIIWSKNHGTQRMFGSYPFPPTIIHTPMTERICVWRKPGKADLSNKAESSKITLEQWKEYAVDKWDIRPETSSKHPAPLPLEIPERIIRLWSFVGDIVLDPFMGSGTVGVACKLLGRNFIGIDYKKEYVELAKERIDG